MRRTGSEQLLPCWEYFFFGFMWFFFPWGRGKLIEILITMGRVEHLCWDFLHCFLLMDLLPFWFSSDSDVAGIHEVLIIPENMTDNTCNMPAFPQHFALQKWKPTTIWEWTSGTDSEMINKIQYGNQVQKHTLSFFYGWLHPPFCIPPSLSCRRRCTSSTVSHP